MVQPVKGFRFGVDSVVLAHAVRSVDIVRVADLGAGTGIISLLMASHGIGREFWLFEKDSVMLECLEFGILLNGLSSAFRVVPADISILDPEDFPKMDVVVFNPPYYPGGRGHGKVGDPRIFLKFAKKLVSDVGIVAYVLSTRSIDVMVLLERELGFRPVGIYDVSSSKGRIFCQLRLLTLSDVWGPPMMGMICVDLVEECGVWWLRENCT